MRPNVDIKKVKDSREHDINSSEGYGTTQMVNGRSKLHLSKRGTRAWRVYRVCTCKGNHKVIPARELSLKKDGNPRRKPTWNTVCPVAAMQLIRHHQPEEWRTYPKWTKERRYGKQNVGEAERW